MENILVQYYVKPELKEQAEALFSAIGMSTADAIQIFLQKCVSIGGLPFQYTAKFPNAETLDAMKELEDGGGEEFDTVDDLFASWREDN
jgi:DNA-damage-inducible protein J